MVVETRWGRHRGGELCGGDRLDYASFQLVEYVYCHRGSPVARAGCTRRPSGRACFVFVARTSKSGGRVGAAEGGPPHVPCAAAGSPGRPLPLDSAPPCPGSRLRYGALGNGNRCGILIPRSRHLCPSYACTAGQLSTIIPIPNNTATSTPHHAAGSRQELDAL